MDDKPNWTKHIEALKSNMSLYIGVMHKLKYAIPLKAHIPIYQSLYNTPRFLFINLGIFLQIEH